jgi:hypothetical protein
LVVVFIIKNRTQIEALASKIDASKELKKLIDNIEESTDCDFAISNLEEISKFQLKQYKNKLDTQNLFNYIKRKIEGYGNLGETNLIVLAQGDGSPEQSRNKVNINEIYQKIKTIHYNFKGKILIIHTIDGINFCIHEVYPSVKKYKQKIDFKKFMQISQNIIRDSLTKHEL